MKKEFILLLLLSISTAAFGSYTVPSTDVDYSYNRYQIKKIETVRVDKDTEFESDSIYARISPNAPIEEFHEEMKMLYNQKKFQRLHNTAAMCAMSYPNDLYGYYYDGIAMYESGQYQQSIRLYGEAIKIAKEKNNKMLPNIYYNRAMSYNKLNNPKKEIKDLYIAYKLLENRVSQDEREPIVQELKRLKKEYSAEFKTVVSEVKSQMQEENTNQEKQF